MFNDCLWLLYYRLIFILVLLKHFLLSGKLTFFNHCLASTLNLFYHVLLCLQLLDLFHVVQVLLLWVVFSVLFKVVILYLLVGVRFCVSLMRAVKLIEFLLDDLTLRYRSLCDFMRRLLWRLSLISSLSSRAICVNCWAMLFLDCMVNRGLPSCFTSVTAWYSNWFVFLLFT